jgi:hypothetical protein
MTLKVGMLLPFLLSCRISLSLVRCNLILQSHLLRSQLQDVTVSVHVPSPVVAMQQQLQLPELPAGSSKGPGEPQVLQVVLQVPAGSSIPAANTAEVRGVALRR